MSLPTGIEAPVLRGSREFPEDLQRLTVQINKTYIDIANCVNARTIGVFPNTRPTITGEIWYILGSFPQQSSRQNYSFGTIAAGTPLSIPDNVTGYTQFSVIRGTCITDFPDSRPIPYVGTSSNDYISLRRDTTTNSIVIAVGSASPNIISGTIVLEWLNNI